MNASWKRRIRIRVLNIKFKGVILEKENASMSYHVFFFIILLLKQTNKLLQYYSLECLELLWIYFLSEQNKRSKNYLETKTK